MIVETRHTRIHYEVVGEGIPFLALHGWAVDRRIMSGCLEPVFEGAWNKKVRRYYLDLPGMGQTPGSKNINGSDAMLDNIEDFIRILFPDSPFLVAGESYGGYLARGLLSRELSKVKAENSANGCNAKGLLLICPVFRPKVESSAAIEKAEIPEHKVVEKDNQLVEGLAPENRAAFEEVAVRQNRRSWELFERDVLPALKIADKNFLNNSLGQNVPLRDNLDAAVNRFDWPTLIVTGRQDSAVGYRGTWSMLESYPRATFAVLDAAGHNAQIEQEKLFHSLVGEWLERLRLDRVIP